METTMNMTGEKMLSILDSLMILRYELLRKEDAERQKKMACEQNGDADGAQCAGEMMEMFRHQIDMAERLFQEMKTDAVNAEIIPDGGL